MLLSLDRHGDRAQKWSHPSCTALVMATAYCCKPMHALLLQQSSHSVHTALLGRAFECCTGRWFIEGRAVGRQQGQAAAGQAACPRAVPCHQRHQASDRRPQSIKRSSLNGPGGFTFASSFDQIMCTSLSLAPNFHLIICCGLTFASSSHSGLCFAIHASLWASAAAMSAVAWRPNDGALACAACAVCQSKCCCVTHGVDAAFMLTHAVSTEGISPDCTWCSA